MLKGELPTGQTFRVDACEEEKAANTPEAKTARSKRKSEPSLEDVVQNELTALNDLMDILLSVSPEVRTRIMQYAYDVFEK